MHILVTITYNALGDGILDPFFACVCAQHDRDFQLLVIDNASTDGTRDYLRALELPNVTVILNEENIGFARACNQGGQIARDRGARYITFLNNDTEFGPTLFADMVASLERSGADGLSPLIPYFVDSDRIWFVMGSWRWLRGIIPYHDYLGRSRTKVRPRGLLETPFAPGCCLLLRFDAFDAVAGFDERFFVYWEDVDLCRDIAERGRRIIVDTQLECLHKVSVSTGGAFSDFSIFHFSRGHVIFVRKHFGALALAWVIPASVAKALANVVFGRLRIRQLPILWHGLMSGLRALS